jgi:signal transduction histidine kinase
MRLYQFIPNHMETILQEWEDFARAIQPENGSMNVLELRDHAEEMLNAIVADMQLAQSDGEQVDKSWGNRPDQGPDSAARSHASARLVSGFSIELLVAEFRALRASVLKHWLQQLSPDQPEQIEDLMRFNEAIDEALAESVKNYSDTVTMEQDVSIGILGHDLRTPLQSVSLGAQRLMHDDSLDSSLIKLGARMYNSVKRMTTMIDNLLDFTQSRIGGGIQVRRKASDLATIGEQVVDELRSYHPQREIRWVMKGDCRGYWDAGRIAQVYQNLVANALQYGDWDRLITVLTEGGPDWVKIHVHNFGAPIAPQEQKRLFNLLHRYTHASGLGETRHNLGLGLYIVSEIVSAHGGTVDVSSSEMEGTEFLVTLPK